MPLASGNATYRTDLPSAVSAMISNNYLTKAGDGLSAPNPKKILLLITDGVNDHSTASNKSSSTGPVNPFDTAQCQNIKNLNFTIYVMYTKYYPVKRFYPGSSHPTNPNQSDWYNSTYNSQVMPFQSPTDQIQTNLQNCASTPDKYYSVSDASSINDAMKSILKAVLAQPGRFTQ